MAASKPAKKVFVDSDVIISSLLSSSGAAFALLNQTEGIDAYLSNFSIIELERVALCLGVEAQKLSNLIDLRLKTVTIEESYDEVKKQYASFVLDVDDAHVVAGAKCSGATYLVSYNIRHFQADFLRSDLDIILMTPGSFLQYLRSL